MGLCVSKPVAIYRETSGGFLEKETHIKPTPELKIMAKAQRNHMISQMGKRAFKNLRPDVETTVEGFSHHW